MAEILGENRYFKQHIEKQEEIITKQNNAINNLINLTKEQSSKLKELETRKITVKFGTEKIENLIDSKFNLIISSVVFVYGTISSTHLSNSFTFRSSSFFTISVILLFLHSFM